MLNLKQTFLFLFLSTTACNRGEMCVETCLPASHLKGHSVGNGGDPITLEIAQIFKKLLFLLKNLVRQNTLDISVYDAVLLIRSEEIALTIAPEGWGPLAEDQKVLHVLQLALQKINSPSPEIILENVKDLNQKYNQLEALFDEREAFKNPPTYTFTSAPNIQKTILKCEIRYLNMPEENQPLRLEIDRNQLVQLTKNSSFSHMMKTDDANKSILSFVRLQESQGIVNKTSYFFEESGMPLSMSLSLPSVVFPQLDARAYGYCYEFISY